MVISPLEFVEQHRWQAFAFRFASFKDGIWHTVGGKRTKVCFVCKVASIIEFNIENYYYFFVCVQNWLSGTLFRRSIRFEIHHFAMGMYLMSAARKSYVSGTSLSISDISFFPLHLLNGCDTRKHSFCMPTRGIDVVDAESRWGPNGDQKLSINIYSAIRDKHVLSAIVGAADI